MAFSAAGALLAVWQWMELLLVSAGGRATCSFSERLDCAQVWTSPFAAQVHSVFGLPIAGLGLQWSLTAFALSLWLVARTVSGAPTALIETSVKAWAALGFLTCITLGVASARLGVACPSCLVTYALTAGFAAAALGGLPEPKLPLLGALLKSLPRALLIALPLHAVLLYPASRTPKSASTALGPLATGEEQVLAYFSRLTPAEAEVTAEARSLWLQEAVPDFPAPPTRQRRGPADAPVKLVDFTDVLCSHCRVLVQTLKELEKAVPEGRISVEPRYFPLDGECNPHAGPPRGDGVRCLGAKVQLCLEGRPEYWEVREQIFENQQSLSTDLLYALATSKGLSRAELDACIASPQTDEKLKADIAWADAYHIDGTPLVLLNGRRALPIAPFLFGMAVAGGDPHSKIFSQLPARTPR